MEEGVEGVQWGEGRGGELGGGGDGRRARDMRGWKV